MSRKSFLQTILLLGSLLVSCNSSEQEDAGAPETTGYEKQNMENFIAMKDVTGKAADVFIKLAESVPSANVKTYSKEGGLDGFVSKKEIKQIFPVKDNERSQDACYIVTYKGGGFAILGADRRIPEILAFSEDSDFPFESEAITLGEKKEAAPSGLRFWLDGMKTAVSLLRTKNINVFADDGSTVGTNNDEPPGSYPDEYPPFSYLLTTKWGQKNGYNQYIPLCSSGQHASAGCGPVALAQIMKYWEFSLVTFDWANMADTYATTATATLLSDIYDATNSFPSVNDNCATGTSQNQLYYALSDYGYSNTNWFHAFDKTIARSQISSDKPVLLFASLSDNTNAHYWVTDGWFGQVMIDPDNHPANSQTRYYFHMNWGWYGNYNGWFYTDNSTLQTNYTFNANSLLMVYNISPAIRLY
ncbi:MAG: C10 family peptidase [Tannerella sp.]|jgi:hypothetical protein|nr:C10 family peptidase [Tannerella sp.]